MLLEAELMRIATNERKYTIMSLGENLIFDGLQKSAEESEIRDTKRKTADKPSEASILTLCEQNGAEC